MIKERETPLNYQITVTNVATIGTKHMADFYISLVSKQNHEWKSPMIHGKVTKQNTRYPWTFIVNSNKLTVNFHELDDKNGTDKVTGSVPLTLMKSQGEEEFLIFGCTESNQGRKVAEVQFTYSQVSAFKSSNQQSKRASLEYTIQIQNYDAKKSLNIIPQQSRQSFANSKLPNNNDTLRDQQEFHPSRLSTLKIQSNRNKFASEDNSNFELNLIKEMQDATDRWYRNNYGRSKPSNLDDEDFDNQNSQTVGIVYEKDYQYLNDISFTSPHMQLKNVIIHSDKRPKAIEIYSIDMDGPRLLKDKIASMQVPSGYKHEWSNAIRLPKEKKAYGIQILTAEKERLQGLINKDSNSSKNSLQIFNKEGKKVGKVNYSLKQIKKIEIQTHQIMKVDPIPQEGNELDKSFLRSQLKTTPNQTQIGLFDTSFKVKNKLMKEIYLNRIKQLPQELTSYKRDHSQQLKSKIQMRKSITNDAYLNQTEHKNKRSLRRNQFQVQIHPFQHEKFTTPLKAQLKNKVASQQQPQQEKTKQKSPQLTKKIEELKKMGSELGKIAKAFPHKKFIKNAKYKTIVYQQQKEEQAFEQKRSLDNSDSEKQILKHKKSYRQPIYGIPYEQAGLVDHTFGKQAEKQQKLKVIPELSKQQSTKNPHFKLRSDEQQQQIPIIRHRTADPSILNQMIQKVQQSEQQKKPSLGVNTQRMTINNVLQSSVTPTTPTQKRPTHLQQNREGDWQGKASSKQQIGSMGESIIANHRTKYSSRTIQPATQLSQGKLNYLITSISVEYYQKVFGSKFVKIYIPNKHYYETPPLNNSNILFWKCSGFLFNNLLDNQDLYVQLYNSLGEERKMLGRVIINSRQFYPNADNAVIRAYLILDSKVVGEIAINYEAVTKNRNKTNRDLSVEPRRREDSQVRNMQTMPAKSKSKRRNKTLNDSLTRFLRKNRKQKINRYIVNQYSRAHIDSRINSIQPKKYTAGKNIVIGRDVRFPYGPDQEHKVMVPGPGYYREKSQFQRYNLEKKKQL